MCWKDRQADRLNHSTQCIGESGSSHSMTEQSKVENLNSKIAMISPNVLARADKVIR